VYLEKVVSKGKIYWRIVKKARINGKVKKVFQYQLGTAENILKLTEREKGEKEIKIKTFAYGKISALLDINLEIGFVENVDRHVKMKRLHGLTPGEYMLLIVMGRCSKPLSKKCNGGMVQKFTT